MFTNKWKEREKKEKVNCNLTTAKRLERKKKVENKKSCPI